MSLLIIDTIRCSPWSDRLTSLIFEEMSAKYPSLKNQFVILSRKNGAPWKECLIQLAAQITSQMPFLWKTIMCIPLLHRWATEPRFININSSCFIKDIVKWNCPSSPCHLSVIFTCHLSTYLVAVENTVTIQGLPNRYSHTSGFTFIAFAPSVQMSGQLFQDKPWKSIKVFNTLSISANTTCVLLPSISIKDLWWGVTVDAGWMQDK